MGIKPFENPRLHGEAVGVLARHAWATPGFMVEFSERTTGFVPTILGIIERGVRAIGSKASQAADSDSDVQVTGGHVRGFQNLCELTLALLGLRELPSGAVLAPGTPRMIRLARSIRLTDSLLTRAGRDVRTSLSFSVEKPDDLGRVTDLAYLTNLLLVGSESGLRVVRVEGD